MDAQWPFVSKIAIINCGKQLFELTKIIGKKMEFLQFQRFVA